MIKKLISTAQNTTSRKKIMYMPFQKLPMRSI